MGSGINLIPAPILERRRQQVSVHRGLTAAAIYLTLLLTATLGYLGFGMPSTADGADARLAIASERAAMLQKKVSGTKAQLARTNHQLLGSRALSERPNWSVLLRLVALAAGSDVTLKDFSLTTTDPTIHASAHVTVAGIASDPWTVSRFVLRLEESGLFDQVKLDSSRREPFRDRTATAFSLSCTLLGGQAAAAEGDQP